MTASEIMIMNELPKNSDVQKEYIKNINQNFRLYTFDLCLDGKANKIVFKNWDTKEEKIMIIAI
tara:strand:+ start:1851 stop:2042 length:192 start_codon:yes stop_codon:yes gene_type:complete